MFNVTCFPYIPEFEHDDFEVIIASVDTREEAQAKADEYAKAHWPLMFFVSETN